MSFKCILVPLDGAAHDRFALRGAFQLGELENAHVTALLCTTPHDDVSAGSVWCPGGVGIVSPEIVRERLESDRDRRTRTSALFEEVRREAGAKLQAEPEDDVHLSGALQFVDDFDINAVARLAPLHDLVVIARGPKGTDDFGFDSLLLESTLLRARRPVMVLPKALPGTFPSQVAIAWSGSVEGALAVSAALPLLERADNVRLVLIDGDPASASSAEGLATYLSWHGIRSVIDRKESSIQGRGTALLSWATDFEADLLIMGGYTHGPLRQAMFGGVTDHVLRHATMPVLMAH